MDLSIASYTILQSVSLWVPGFVSISLQLCSTEQVPSKKIQIFNQFQSRKIQPHKNTYIHGKVPTSIHLYMPTHTHTHTHIPSYLHVDIHKDVHVYTKI